MRRYFAALLSLIVSFGPCEFSHSAETPSPDLTFSSEDRVLVIAPHPDDETLGTGGIIQRARKAGASVKVMFLTNGEFNEISSISYQVKPLLVKSDFLLNGRTRKAEAIRVLEGLGLKKEDLVFLGYPDSGTLRIWQKHWGEGKPFKSFFTRINKVLNKDDYSFGQYYRGDNILADYKSILSSYKPTKIFVTAPFDINYDHQASYLFLNLSLLDLKDQLNPKPHVYLYIIHQKGWPKPRKLDTTAAMTMPEAMKSLHTLQWKEFLLTDDEIARKKEAVMGYKTQIAYSKNFMLSFVRKNELYLEMSFENLAPEPREEEGFLDDPFLKIDVERDVKYRTTLKSIFIDIPLRTKIEEMGAITSDIFGYRRNVNFEDIPKLSLKFFGKRLSLKDGKQNFSDPRITYTISQYRILIRIPRDVLKNPDYLFVSTRSTRDVVSPGFGAWRILRLEDVR